MFIAKNDGQTKEEIHICSFEAFFGFNITQMRLRILKAKLGVEP